MKNFDDIRRLVMADPHLMDALTTLTTGQELLDAVVQLGHRNGIEVTTTDLEALVNANRRAWFERWTAL